MNLEENRLQTFVGWPTNAVISPTRIAKAGFYYTNQNLKVKCFSCDVEISEWNYGDQVMARHRQLSPRCAFVVDPTTSGNVPNISNTEETMASCNSVGSCRPFIQETARLESFANWPVPHIVAPDKLASAGFYYLMHNDRTKCAFCDGIVLSWEEGDDPDREHKRHFPNCHFVQTVINPRLQQQTIGDNIEENTMNNDLNFSNVSVVSQDNLRELGINEHTAPKRSQYATLESRIRTFAMWPDDLIQTPNILAQAGFYYEGYGDQVRCFHCDGGLRHWDPQDDPWTEHARWFPSCAFVLLVKGQEFVTACAIENHSASNTDLTTHNHTMPFQRHEVTEREIQLQMLTPEVVTALNIGLHVSRVKRAIKEKLERTGVGFSTPDAVIEAALNIQLEEDEISDSRIAEQVSSILTNAIQHTLNRSPHTKQENQNPTSVTEPSSTQPTRPNVVTEDSHFLEEENRQLREARLCKICMDNEVGIVFLPCGHLTTCVNCAPNLRDCPVCRSTIKATVRTFLS